MKLLSKERRTDPETYAQEYVVTLSISLEQLQDTRLNNLMDDFCSYIGEEVINYIYENRNEN